MLTIPRERYVGVSVKEDRPVAVGHGQTSSAPSVIAQMLDLLNPQTGERVLDVGCGVGYTSALLKYLVKDGEVIGVDVHADLIERAQRLTPDVKFLVGNALHMDLGSFDVIHVGAACSERAFFELARRLKPGGRIVAPVKRGPYQFLRLGRRSEELRWEDLFPVVFVEMKE